MGKSYQGWLTGCFAASVFFVAISGAGAQTTPDLMIKPWPRDQVIQTETDALFYNETTTGNAPADGSSRYARYTLSEYDSFGRARLFPRDETVRADPRVGYNVQYLKLDTNDPNLPKKLTNESLGFGMGVADMDGWLAAVQASIGYAGAGAFQDGNAWYGRADIIVGRELDKNTQVGFVLDYDGNRSFLPDVPLPGFAYRKTIDPTLLLAAGFPTSSVTWTPDKSHTLDRQLTIEGDFDIPDSLTGRVDWAVIDTEGKVGKVGLYVSYSDRTMPFFDNQLPVSHYRLFYSQRRGELGVSWVPNELITLLAAGGYAFDQQFSEGWSTRNDHHVAKPGDELYTRVSLDFHY